MSFQLSQWLLEIFQNYLQSSPDRPHSAPLQQRGANETTMTTYFLMSICNIWKNIFKNIILGTNLVLGPPEKFYRRNPSGTFRDVHWYHLGDPKKVPGAPSQGFLTFLGFDKNSTKIEIWLSYPHFSADFQVSYHFGKLLTARSQGFTALIHIYHTFASV